MMKKLLLPTLIMVIFICLQSCKKSDNTPPQSTIQKIQNIWLLDKMVINSHYAGSNNNTSTIGTATDYFDFRTDGKIYFSLAGSKDTVTYTMSSDTKILIDGTELYDITTLTSTAFIIYKKETSGANYSEETITWKR